jgi:serine acetyltransferase
MKRVPYLLLMLLPSWLKVVVLRFLGHEIGRDVRIGYSYLDIDTIVLKDGTRIGHLNYFKNLRGLTMLEGARIGGYCNWFTATAANDEGNPQFGTLQIGRGSNMTGRHYFDLQDGIVIGDETLIAGFGSVFLTHTYTPDRRNVNAPIRVGDRCYVGSRTIFLPGTAVGPCCFIGAGAVITKDFSSESGVLIAGNPARIKRQYPRDAWFFVADHSSFLPRQTH